MVHRLCKFHIRLDGWFNPSLILRITTRSFASFIFNAVADGHHGTSLTLWVFIPKNIIFTRVSHPVCRERTGPPRWAPKTLGPTLLRWSPRYAELSRFRSLPPAWFRLDHHTILLYQRGRIFLPIWATMSLRHSFSIRSCWWLVWDCNFRTIALCIESIRIPQPESDDVLKAITFSFKKNFSAYFQ